MEKCLNGIKNFHINFLRLRKVPDVNEAFPEPIKIASMYLLKFCKETTQKLNRGRKVCEFPREIENCGEENRPTVSRKILGGLNKSSFLGSLLWFTRRIGNQPTNLQVNVATI